MRGEVPDEHFLKEGGIKPLLLKIEPTGHSGYVENRNRTTTL